MDKASKAMNEFIRQQTGRQPVTEATPKQPAAVNAGEGNPAQLPHRRTMNDWIRIASLFRSTEL